jgi:hypothetical protein
MADPPPNVKTSASATAVKQSYVLFATDPQKGQKKGDREFLWTCHLYIAAHQQSKKNY